MAKIMILNLMTNPKKFRRPNPKNEDDLTKKKKTTLLKKRRRPNPKNENELTQKN